MTLEIIALCVAVMFAGLLANQYSLQRRMDKLERKSQAGE